MHTGESSSASSVTEKAIEDTPSNDQGEASTVLSQEDMVVKAETIQALKVLNHNYSFLSTTDDGDRFRLLFSDSYIAKKYQMSKTKVSYVI